MLVRDVSKVVAVVAASSKTFLVNEAANLTQVTELTWGARQEPEPQTCWEVFGRLQMLEQLLTGMIGWSASEEESTELAAQHSQLQGALERSQQNDGNAMLLAQVGAQVLLYSWTVVFSLPKLIFTSVTSVKCSVGVCVTINERRARCLYLDTRKS